MSESKFNDRNIDNPVYYHNYTNANSENPYLFVSNSYNGAAGYKDGTYLVPFDREAWYEKRKALSFYRNYMKGIINSLVDPVFNAPIIRTTDIQITEEFINNVDNCGTNLTRFAKEAVLQSRLHGVTFIVMDNFSDIPVVESDAIKLRRFPYAYIQPAYTVKSYDNDDFGNIKSITFYGEDRVVGKQKQTSDITWTDVSSIITYYVDDKPVDVIVKNHNLKTLPVISLYSVLIDKVMVDSPWYDVAKLQLALFNKDSELRDQERAQAFSIFYIQTSQKAANLGIGPHGAIILPVDNNISITPGFASPDSGLLDILQKGIEGFITTILESSQKYGVVGVKQATSGIAESYKFFSTNQELKTTANLGEEFERKLINLFDLYIKKNSNFKTVYTQNYDTYYSKLTIDDYIKLLSLELPDEVKQAIKKNIISVYLDNYNREDLDRLKNLIK